MTDRAANLLSEFQDPPQEYSPVPFWFLNERLDTERLQWQVREMRDKHVYGAVMHARPGLVTPYLSEEWFARIGDILEQARASEMFMWIYDEYPWMSGMAEYRVPKINPDFRIRALDKLERFVDGPATLEWNIAAELPSDNAGIVAVTRTAVEHDVLAAPGEDITHELRDGRLSLSLPAGGHHIAVFFERLSYNPYGDGFGRHEVSDIMHPEAVEAFLRLTHREYQRRFSEYLGTTITATFTDEPPSDTPGWSRIFLQEFEHRKCYDLRPFLAALWRSAGSETGKVRFDYNDVLGQLYEENFFGALEGWADGVGIASAGHLLLEETLPFHARFMGDYFRALRRLHYPGIDYIVSTLMPPVVCKMAASVANLYGRKRVMSESFALTGWDFSLEQMKWMTNWQLVHGVNLLVPHGFFFSITEDEPIAKIPHDLGFRWYDCPPSMFYQQPYWDYYSSYADYARRACFLISQGDHVCGIGVYYPIESVQAEFVPAKEYANLHAFEIPGTWPTADYLWDGAPIEQIDAHFRAAADGLRYAGLDYDVVDDDSLRDASAASGALTVRGRREYRALVLPHTSWIALDVYRTIEQFWESGGLVIATACMPAKCIDGPEHDKAVAAISQRIFGSASSNPGLVLDRPTELLAERLRSHGLGDFECSSPHVFSQHRRINQLDMYFLVHHHDEESGEVEVKLRGTGPVTLLDPYSGASCQAEWRQEDAGTVTLRVRFHPYQALFAGLGEGALTDESAGPTGNAQFHPGELNEALEIPGPWHVRLDGGDRHALRVRDLPPLPVFEELPKEFTWDALAPWEELGLGEFSGGATYETSFVWSGGSTENVWLDLGDVGIAAEVTLNDQPLGIALWRPYLFRAGHALQAGENHVRIRVVNTLANSIQASYGSGRIPTKASHAQIEQFARFEPGRLRSGLIGPVRLFTATQS